MKALLITSLLLLSLGAMADSDSARQGENQKSDCEFANQQNREPKVVAPAVEEKKDKPAEVKSVSI